MPGFPDVMDTAPNVTGYTDGVQNLPIQRYSDLNGDGVVDQQDLFLFGETWHQ